MNPNSELCYRNNPKSLFRKYARLITSLTKHQAFRDFVMDGTMPLPDKIALLLPNGYHEHLGGNHYRMTVTTRAVYSPKLYFSLLKLDLMLDRWALSFEDQQTVLLMDLGLKRYSFEYPQIFLAQETFNPNASPESTSVDGYAARVTTEIWATIRAGAGTTADDLGVSLFCQYSTGTAPNWGSFYRTFTLFDTSSLPDNAVIDSAIQSFYTVTDGNFAVSLRIVTTTPASNTAIVAADYSQTDTVAQATDRTTASMAINQYNDWTLNATGLGNISKTGITKFGLRVVGDADNVEPTPGDGQTSNMREHQTAEDTNKPKLVVTYTVPGGAQVFPLF